MPRILRTPDDRFDNLPGFPYQPRYIRSSGPRTHYVDEGIRNSGEVLLCLHGEPTWSYLYRKMIPVFADQHRVLAMDFIGFGRSDKYADPSDYSFGMHLATLDTFVRELGLTGITLIVHDWGGLIGLTYASQFPQRFRRLIIMNTGLPGGKLPPSDAFMRWRRFVEKVGLKLPISRVVFGGLAHPDSISAAELEAYEAPFPDASFKAGAAVWPLLVPMKPTDPGAKEMRQAQKALAQWSKPALVVFSDHDPITRGGEVFFRRLLPAAEMVRDSQIRDAGHFLQEDKGAEIAVTVLDFMTRSSHAQAGA